MSKSTQTSLLHGLRTPSLSRDEGWREEDGETPRGNLWPPQKMKELRRQRDAKRMPPSSPVRHREDGYWGEERHPFGYPSRQSSSPPREEWPPALRPLIKGTRKILKDEDYESFVPRFSPIPRAPPPNRGRREDSGRKTRGLLKAVKRGDVEDPPLSQKGSPNTSPERNPPESGKTLPVHLPQRAM